MKYLFLNLLCMLSMAGRTQSILPIKYLQKDFETNRLNYTSNIVATPALTIKSKNFLAKSSTLATPIDVFKPFYFLPTCLAYRTLFKDDNPKFFQNNFITYSDSLNNIALYSEIVADYLGPVRVSTGITMSYPKNAADSADQLNLNREKFVQRLSSGSGALNFNFGLPLYYLSTGPLTSIATLSPRFSIEPPSFGISSSTFPINTSLAADIQLHLITVKKVFDISGNVRWSYVAGNSSFYNMLQLTGRGRKGFWLNSYTAGVVVKEKFSLSYTGFWGTKVIKDRINPSIMFTVDQNF